MYKFGASPGYIISSAGRFWQARIGLEIHANINSKTKLFSPAPHFASDKNSRLALFDIALPGTLPQLNTAVVEKSLRAALALKCKVNLLSHFDRKHYFYQDLPLGYQITQQSRPIGEKGLLPFQCVDENGDAVSTSVVVNRIQIEQDSARSIHDLNQDFTLIDFNRAGAALVEIVFAPTIRTPKLASSVLQHVQQLLRHIDVSTGNMEDGSLRCDVNVSVSSCDESGNIISAGPKVEVKNISSLYRVETAAAFEVSRQIESLLSGEVLHEETRGFNAATGTTFHLRLKETNVDYRFFPDPDLPPLVISQEELCKVTSELPEAIEMSYARVQKTYSFSGEQMSTLQSMQVMKYFEEAMNLIDVSVKVQFGTTVFNWLCVDLAGIAGSYGVQTHQYPLTPRQFVDILQSVDRGDITTQQGKMLLRKFYETTEFRVKNLSEVLSVLGWRKISDDSLVRNICQQVIDDPKNAKMLQKYKGGHSNSINFFFGSVMKECKGQADPIVVKKILEEMLK